MFRGRGCIGLKFETVLGLNLGTVLGLRLRIVIGLRLGIVMGLGLGIVLGLSLGILWGIRLRAVGFKVLSASVIMIYYLITLTLTRDAHERVHGAYLVKH